MNYKISVRTLMPPVRSGYGGGIVRGKAAVAIPLIWDIGHENYEVFDDSGRAARSDDFGKVAEHHEHGRERPSKAIFRTSRELLKLSFPPRETVQRTLML